MSHIHDLREVIQRLHGADAKHVESVPITETHQGKTVWDGVVEVFDLIGHPETHPIYAWSHETDEPKKPKRHVTVLHIPPVISPQIAVRAAIIQECRNNA
ncbi:MAG TPA: hypothetical protein VGK24_02420 [Candidatus Angelobacter sp.]|jgi:hypothetical protein